jgi:hypothetical protein
MAAIPYQPPPRWTAILIGMSLLSAGCVPYKPTVSLERSPHTIPASVAIQPLRDATPPDDRDNLAEHSISQTGTLEGELSALVTQALEADFSATGLFRSIGTRERDPDLILTGTIHRFYGQATVLSWLIPGAGWTVNAVASPSQAWQGEVDLELTLTRPDGRVLGTYRGRARYDEIASYDHHYWAMPLYPAHARLNQAFSEAVQDVREQILRDRGMLTGGLGRDAHP